MQKYAIVKLSDKRAWIHHSNNLDTYIWVVCGSKNEHQIDICFKEIGPYAQNMLTTMGFIVNMIGCTYMTT